MTVKISNLPAATSVGSGDVLPVVQSGTTKKIDLNSPWSINIDGGNIDGTPIGVSSASSGAFSTLTASDDVNFDSGTLFVDASENNVGIGKTPASFLKLDVNGLLGVSSSSTPILQIGDIGGTLRFQGITSLDQTFWTNNQERMRIDSSGNLRIGTTVAGSYRAVIKGTADAVLQLDTSSANGPYINFVKDGSTNAGYIGASASIITGGTTTSLGLRSENNLLFSTNGNAERMRIDSSGQVGIGTTSPSNKLHITSSFDIVKFESNTGSGVGYLYADTAGAGIYSGSSFNETAIYMVPNSYMDFRVNGSERMRIDSSGNVTIGQTVASNDSGGLYLTPTGLIGSSLLDATGGQQNLLLNRQNSDGALIIFRQANITEGTISVSGSTVSYNGGHLSRWSRLASGKQDASILKGTVMTNLDAMVDWEGEDNEQLNQMAVSSVEGDPNVSGVFVNWDNSDDWNDMNIAMTGDMIIRIGAGVTVERGDLLMSAGDGTAKPQGDDVVKSKTIAKVTSTHVTCTYNDGSYCVPCVLMAC